MVRASCSLDWERRTGLARGQDAPATVEVRTGFLRPASDTLELIASNAPCTGLIPSGRALILSILSILSKKQRQDGQDSQD